MPTPGEQAARDALRSSVETNQQEVRLASETITLLRSEVRNAVAEGIAGAMTEEAAERFWTKGLEVLQRQATVKTGRFVLGGLGELAKKVMWIGVFVGAVYSIGGWTAVKTLWAALPRGGTP